MDFVDKRQREIKHRQRRQREIAAGGAVVVVVRGVGVARIVGFARVVFRPAIFVRNGFVGVLGVPAGVSMGSTIARPVPGNGRLHHMLGGRVASAWHVVSRRMIVRQPDEQPVEHVHPAQQQGSQAQQARGDHGTQ
jgi:hypothetical protein